MSIRRPENMPIGINLIESETIDTLTTRSHSSITTLTITSNDDITSDVILSRLREAVRNLGDSAHITLTQEVSTKKHLDNDLF